MFRSWFRKPAETFLFPYENVLGTSLEIRIRASSASQAELAEQRALQEIDRLEPIFSSYNPDSEFRRWQSHGGLPTPLSHDLLAVLQESEQWQAWSGGAFNPASEVLVRLWREAIQAGRVPSTEEVAVLRERVAQALWKVDAGTATCLTDCPLTLNSIAKGYIVDRACDAAMETGIEGIVLNIGGDLRIRSRAAEPVEERVGVTDPRQDAENAPPITCIRFHEGALATSGDWRRGFRLGEKLYSHLIDPRTGIPAEKIRSASVFASTAAEADVLATICSVLTPEESLALIETLPDVSCFLVASDQTIYRNRRWQEREVPAT